MLLCFFENPDQFYIAWASVAVQWRDFGALLSVGPVGETCMNTSIICAEHFGDDRSTKIAHF